MLIDECVVLFAVFTVLLQLKETMSLGELSMAIRSMPVAQALFLQVDGAERKGVLYKTILLSLKALSCYINIHVYCRKNK